LAKAGELFDVDMDQVSGTAPLVALDMELGFHVPQPTQPKAVENPRHGGEGETSILAMCSKCRHW